MPSLAAIPSPEHGWILASGSRRLGESEDLASLASSRGEVVVGIPSPKVSLFSVVLPPTDESLHESMIFAQVEKRGLAQSPEGASMIDFRLLRKSSSGDSFLVSVVSPLGEGMIVPSASGYELAAVLRPVPAAGAALWKEQGRLVLGLFEEGVLLHLQVLNGATGLGAAAAQEISLILLSLAGDPVLGERLPSRLEVSLERGPEDDSDAFSKGMRIPVEFADVSVLTGAKLTSRDRLLPPEVVRARRSASLRTRTLTGLAVGLIVYVVAVSWLWIHSERIDERIASLEDQVEILAPDVERVQLGSQRWKKLEPAFEKSYFPLVQLNRITSALPGSGVVIREFRTENRVIRLEGQAKDVQLANRLLEDLRNMPEMSSYSWKLTSNKVEKNNTANFRMEATLKNAGTDE